jgi:hypothetical protein
MCNPYDIATRGSILRKESFGEHSPFYNSLVGLSELIARGCGATIRAKPAIKASDMGINVQKAGRTMLEKAIQ